MERIIEKIAEINPKAITLEGLDKAIVGTSLTVDDELPRLAYSVEKILEILTNRDGMTRDEAQEFFDFNIFNAYMGEYNPSFIFDMEPNPTRKEVKLDIPLLIIDSQFQASLIQAILELPGHVSKRP